MFKFSLPVPPIKTVSTIGAGDNFNAGLIYSIFRKDLNRQDLLNPETKTWKQILENGIKFSSHVCQSMDNYISNKFAEEIK